MKKVLMMVLLILLPISVSYAEIEGNVIIDLELIQLESVHKTGDVNVEYIKTDKIIKAIVNDKRTGREIESYSINLKDKDLLNENLPMATRNSGGYINVHMTKNFNTTSSYSTELQALAEVRLYKENVGGSPYYTVIDVLGTDHYLIGSGAYVLETKYTSESYHTDKSVVINCTGVYFTTRSTALQYGFDASVLGFMGFDITFIHGSDWIARRPYNEVVRINAIR